MSLCCNCRLSVAYLSAMQLAGSGREGGREGGRGRARECVLLVLLEDIYLIYNVSEAKR
jgi:hypothetical protein